jgi:S1-C subfamily serine protease
MVNFFTADETDSIQPKEIQMATKIATLVLSSVFLMASGPVGLAQDNARKVQKQQEYRIVSLDLQFSKKGGDVLEGALSLLFGADPNGYATGFIVGDGLVMTAYHVVSGELSEAKKINLGFKADDQLEVRVFVKGCRATVIKINKEADLALLETCHRRQANAPAFQAEPKKDENLVLLARPHGNKMVSRGRLFGSYIFRGQEYWSAKIDSHDGYSGSPVYNQQSELIGVFTGYDRVQDVALISPAAKAQKLLADYMSSAKP